MEDRSGGGNIVVAVILSVIVLFAWDYFFAPKQTKPLVPTSDVSLPTTDPALNVTDPSAETLNNKLVNNPVASQSVSAFEPLDDVLADSQNQRIMIQTNSVVGSISLKTGRFDDLILKNHDLTLKSKEKIRLLAPSNTQKGFFAEIDYSISNIDPKNKVAWQLVSGNTLSFEKPVTLKKTIGSVEVLRTISIDQNYMFQISDQLTNNGTQNIFFTPYGLIKENQPSFLQKESSYVVHTGFVGYVNDSLIEETFEDVKDQKYIDGSLDDVSGGWIGITDKYWAAVLIPDNNEMLKLRALYNPFAGEDGYQADYTLKTRALKAGATLTLKNKLFSGAKSVRLINQYADQYQIKGFDFLIDWGWFWFFTRPIFKGLLYLYALVGNYGIAILFLTLILKTFFFPLANKSYTAMSRMKKLQPELEKIKQKNAKDPMAQQQELIALYKREKVNPVAGCWPMLLQIPVFFALYKVLNVALELRHQPFYGWIHDLSAADPTNIFTLFGLIPVDLPSFLHIGIWPLLMGITMWMQQRLNPAPSDPIQGKMMSLFPIIFTFILAPFSAGLVIYWTWNNILSVIQQAVIMKRLGVPIEFRLWPKTDLQK